jgi:hypothetical protein
VAFAVENLRLKELAVVAEKNRPAFDDFVSYLRVAGYRSLHQFAGDQDIARAHKVLDAYLRRPLPKGVALFNGVAQPYPDDTAKWNLVGWVFRDAPTQRLRPMLASMPGADLTAKKAALLNIVRLYASTICLEPEKWTWPVIAEVVIDRLEGSRRAIKGSLFEAIVRRHVATVFAENGLPLEVRDAGIKLEGETFDVSVRGPKGEVLMPVKTRETMGGGHAGLFTRDIHKAINAAYHAGYECLPVIIAESWVADLRSLNCKDQIYIDKNPNQIDAVEPLLAAAIKRHLDTFRTLM